jgi:hypothetical protein
MFFDPALIKGHVPVKSGQNEIKILMKIKYLVVRNKRSIFSPKT